VPILKQEVQPVHIEFAGPQPALIVVERNDLGTIGIISTVENSKDHPAVNVVIS
jgi:hypothetical protein